MPSKKRIRATVWAEILTAISLLSKMLQTIFTVHRNVGGKTQIMVNFSRANLRSEKFKFFLNYAASTGKYLPTLEEWYSNCGVKKSERCDIQKDFFFITRNNNWFCVLQGQPLHGRSVETLGIRAAIRTHNAPWRLLCSASWVITIWSLHWLGKTKSPLYLGITEKYSHMIAFMAVLWSVEVWNSTQVRFWSPLLTYKINMKLKEI